MIIYLRYKETFWSVSLSIEFWFCPLSSYSSLMFTSTFLELSLILVRTFMAWSKGLFSSLMSLTLRSLLDYPGDIISFSLSIIDYNMSDNTWEFLKGVTFQPHTFTQPESKQHLGMVDYQIKKALYQDTILKIQDIISYGRLTQRHYLYDSQETECGDLSLPQRLFLNRKLYNEQDLLVACSSWNVVNQMNSKQVRRFEVRYYQTIQDIFYPIVMPKGIIDSLISLVIK